MHLANIFYSPLLSGLLKSLALALSTATAIVCYAEYPERPIRIIVPYAVGGTTDQLSRMIGERLSPRLGQPVLIDNKPGGSEQLAVSTLKQGAPDGYTIMISNVGGLAINPSLFGSKLSYNVEKDLQPIILAASLPSVFFVHPSMPVSSLDELTDYLKKNPDKVNYASSGTGQPSHLGMELYKSMVGVSANHVPYKGGAPAQQDLVAGQTHVMVAIAAEGMPWAKAGKLKPLAITTSTQSPLFPELTPAAEAKGLKGYELPTWYGYVAKTGTPKAVIDKLNQSINEVLKDAGLRTKLAEIGIETLGGSPQELESRIEADTVKWRKVITEANIKLD